MNRDSTVEESTMMEAIHYKSPLLQRIVAEGDVRFLLARLQRHAPDIYHHSLRVAGLFDLLWSERDIVYDRETALRSALLHDIGCIHTPREELHTPPEQHTKDGADLLGEMIRQGRVDREMILYHHENLDGTGYPFGVGWKRLSPSVRTLRIIDAFDHWAGGIYTELAVSVAMEDLYRWADVQFDSLWLERFHKMIRQAVRDIPQELDRLSRM
jgi:putative nucleotidyltransferase with HDIG domain